MSSLHHTFSFARNETSALGQSAEFQLSCEFETMSLSLLMTSSIFANKNIYSVKRQDTDLYYKVSGEICAAIKVQSNQE